MMLKTINWCFLRYIILLCFREFMITIAIKDLDQTLSLAMKEFIGVQCIEMYSDYIANCPCCQIAKGLYPGPNTQLGPLIAMPMELSYMVFLKADPLGDGKENVLVSTDAF